MNIVSFKLHINLSYLISCREIYKKIYFRIRKINNTVENFHQKLLRPMNFLFSWKKVLCSEREGGKKRRIRIERRFASVARNNNDES